MLDESAEDLFEHAPCGYLSTLPDGKIVRVNETFLTWTGHTREALLGRRRFVELLTPGGRIYHETHYAPLLQMQGAVREIALEIVCADGRRLPVLVNSTLRADAGGRPLVIRTTVFDATDRKAYERELMRARERAQLLAETAHALGEAQTLTARAQLLVEVVVPQLAAGARVEVAGDDGPRIVATAGESSDAGGSAPAVLALRARGRLVGSLVVVGPRGDESVLTELAEQAALALENARLYEHEHRIAHAMQQSLLAAAPMSDPRVTIATSYQAGVVALDVGGDWHDAFLIAPGRLAVTVGDVVGHGLEAASAMGQLRSALRALAGDAAGPAQVLDRLDRFVRQFGVGRAATVALADIDLGSGLARFACAGHMPPALLAPGEPPRLLWEGRSPPLDAVGDIGPRAEAQVVLRPGARLLLYSDGLVERRGVAIDAGLDALLGRLGGLGDATPAQIVAALGAAMVEPEGATDDVCLLCLALEDGVTRSG